MFLSKQMRCSANGTSADSEKVKGDGLNDPWMKLEKHSFVYCTNEHTVFSL